MQELTMDQVEDVSGGNPIIIGATIALAAAAGYAVYQFATHYGDYYAQSGWVRNIKP